MWAWCSAKASGTIGAGEGGVDAKGRKPITEYHSIHAMRTLNKDGYTEWKDKSSNKLNNVRPGYERVLKYIEKNSDKPIDEAALELEVDLIPHDVTVLAFKEEVWSVLMDKSEGEARGKIKATREQGHGVEAYRALHE